MTLNKPWSRSILHIVMYSENYYVEFDINPQVTEYSGVIYDLGHVFVCTIFLIFPPWICESVCPAFVHRILQGSANPCGKYNPNFCGVTHEPGEIKEIFHIIASGGVLMYQPVLKIPYWSLAHEVSLFKHVRIHVRQRSGLMGVGLQRKFSHVR